MDGDTRQAGAVSQAVRHVIPGYRLVEPLGEGGMGVVYRAVDERTGREVALKVLASGTDADLATRRFRREFRAAARLRHPHVAQVFDFHPEPPLYYTLELVDGRPLDRVLAAESGGLDEPGRMSRLRALVGQVLVALDAVHGAELVHRDLKPENILVTSLPAGPGLPFDPPGIARGFYEPVESGEVPFVKLVDFGLVWVGDQSGDLTKTGIIVGTVDYVSPEQVLGGEIDPRTDLYSLGVVLFELLTGRCPFIGRDTVSVLLKHAYEEAPPPSRFNPAVDPGLDRFTLRLLAKDPADRFPSAREALAALAGADRAERSRPSTTLRLSPRPQGLLPPRLVGREVELAQARDALAEVRAGSSRVLFISGEAGIGKSRLAEEVKRQARMQGLAVYAAAAHDQQGYAYAAVLPILDALARDAARLPRDRALAAAAATLARLAPRWQDLIEPGAPEAARLPAEEERYRVLGAVAEVAGRLAPAAGTLLVLDDAQWADPSSLELLAYWLRNRAAAGAAGEPAPALLLLATIGEEDLDPAGQAARWRDTLRRAEGVLELRLDRLEAGEIEAMAASMLGAESAPGEVVSWLKGESQGVPFLVGEMLAAFAAEGALVLDGPGGPALRRRASGALAFPQALPPSVAELVARRLDKLEERERRVAAAAAIVGAEVPFDLLLAASGLEEDELLDALQELIRRRILLESRDDPDLFVFSARAARGVLLEETFERRRRKAHERIAQALEGRERRHPADVIGLAHHWLSAGRIEPGLGYLVEAVELHRLRLDHDEALVAARRALGLVEAEPARGGDGLRLRLLADIGELEAVLCHYERGAQSFRLLLEAAEGLSQRALQAMALLGLADIDLRRGDYVEAERRSRAALEAATAAGAAELLGRAQTSLGRIAWHLGRPGEALAAFAEALRVERERGDELGQAKALHNIGYARLARGELAEAERQFEEGLGIFRGRDNRTGVARALEAIATVAQRRGHYGRVAAALAEACGIMRELGDRRGEAYCVVSEGNLHAYQGSWLEALGRYDQAEETFAELGEVRGKAFCASNRGRVLTSLGAYGEALVSLGLALKLSRKIAEKGEVAFCLYALAEIARELGDVEGAERCDASAIELFREQGERYGLGLALAGRAWTAVLGADPVRAEAASAEALALVEQASGMPEVETRARLGRARALGSAEEAAGAVAAASAARLPELEALALGLEAELRAASGEPERARDLAARAVRLVERLAATLEGRRDAFLRRPPIAALLRLAR